MLAPTEKLIESYENIKLVREDLVFKWYEARTKGSEVPVVLQVTKPVLAAGEIPSLKTYMQKAQEVVHENLYVPVEVTTDPRTLLARYRSVDWIGMDKADVPRDELMRWFHDVTQALMALHVRKIYHGFVGPVSVGRAGGKVLLGNFGFASLLNMRQPQAIAACAGYIAPELSDREGTSAADVYSFGKLVEYFVPEIKDTPWFAQATAPSPTHRHTSIRKAFDQLDGTFGHLGARPSGSGTALDPPERVIEATPDGGATAPYGLEPLTSEPEDISPEPERKSARPRPPSEGVPPERFHYSRGIVPDPTVEPLDSDAEIPGRSAPVASDTGASETLEGIEPSYGRPSPLTNPSILVALVVGAVTIVFTGVGLAVHYLFHWF